MLKILSFVAAILVTAQAAASPYMQMTEQQITFDKVVCSVTAENYSRGELAQRDIRVHSVKASTYPMSDDIYGVYVDTEIFQDEGLIGKGPGFAYSCFRCPNLKLVVSQDTMRSACANEQK